MPGVERIVRETDRFAVVAKRPRHCGRGIESEDPRG